MSLTLLALFFVFLVGQALVGQRHYNDEQQQHGQPALSLSEYLTSADFLEATAENWESEFLQMGAYVLFTCFLFQRGSSESKKPGESEPVDRDPRLSKNKRDVPSPVRRGGWILRVYSYSLSLAFIALFLASFIVHAVAGAEARNEEEILHGGETISVLEYMGSSQFWFESFQNWQSEFLAIGAMVVLSIFFGTEARRSRSQSTRPIVRQALSNRMQARLSRNFFRLETFAAYH